MLVKACVCKEAYSVAVNHAAAKRVGFPEVPSVLVEIFGYKAQVIRSTILAFAITEETEEVFVRRKIFQRGEL